MMRKEFSQYIGESIMEGFNRGVTMFMETLNEEIYRDYLCEKIGTDNIVANLTLDDLRKVKK